MIYLRFPLSLLFHFLLDIVKTVKLLNTLHTPTFVRARVKCCVTSITGNDVVTREGAAACLTSCVIKLTRSLFRENRVTASCEGKQTESILRELL